MNFLSCSLGIPWISTGFDWLTSENQKKHHTPQRSNCTPHVLANWHSASSWTKRTNWYIHRWVGWMDSPSLLGSTKRRFKALASSKAASKTLKSPSKSCPRGWWYCLIVLKKKNCRSEIGNILEIPLYQAIIEHCINSHSWAEDKKRSDASVGNRVFQSSRNQSCLAEWSILLNFHQRTQWKHHYSKRIKLDQCCRVQFEMLLVRACLSESRSSRPLHSHEQSLAFHGKSVWPKGELQHWENRTGHLRPFFNTTLGSMKLCVEMIRTPCPQSKRRSLIIIFESS